MAIEATPTPCSKLLTPKDHTLFMIDFQSQMAFATKNIDMANLRNNAALVARSAKGFGVSTILTTVAEKSFSGPMFSEITDAFPEQKLFDRTSMNTWEDAEVIKEVNRIGQKRIVLSLLKSIKSQFRAGREALLSDARRNAQGGDGDPFIRDIDLNLSVTALF